MKMNENFLLFLSFSSHSPQKKKKKKEAKISPHRHSARGKNSTRQLFSCVSVLALISPFFTIVKTIRASPLHCLLQHTILAFWSMWREMCESEINFEFRMTSTGERVKKFQGRYSEKFANLIWKISNMQISVGRDII